MNYAEASYFDGYHFAHIAAFLDEKWRNDRRKRAAERLAR